MIVLASYWMRLNNPGLFKPFIIYIIVFVIVTGIIWIIAAKKKLTKSKLRHHRLFGSVLI
jgi:hypothetical protein